MQFQSYKWENNKKWTRETDSWIWTHKCHNVAMMIAGREKSQMERRAGRIWWTMDHSSPALWTWGTPVSLIASCRWDFTLYRYRTVFFVFFNGIEQGINENDQINNFFYFRFCFIAPFWVLTSERLPTSRGRTEMSFWIGYPCVTRYVLATKMSWIRRRTYFTSFVVVQ